MTDVLVQIICVCTDSLVKRSSRFFIPSPLAHVAGDNHPQQSLKKKNKQPKKKRQIIILTGYSIRTVEVLNVDAQRALAQSSKNSKIDGDSSFNVHKYYSLS